MAFYPFETANLWQYSHDNINKIKNSFPDLSWNQIQRHLCLPVDIYEGEVVHKQHISHMVPSGKSSSQDMVVADPLSKTPTL